MGCPTCEFDPAEWNDADVRNTIEVADLIVHYAIETADPSLVAQLAAHARQAARDQPDVEGLHRLFHRLVDIDIARRAAGDVPAPMSGSVSAINRSGGGVPKLPIDTATIGRRGVQGDRQRNRRHHGRPIQALCLFSADVIEALRAEGHPIEAGSAGENLTLAGIDWAELRSGLVVEIGAMTARITTPAPPCSHNNRWFADGDSQRISHDRHPGWARWYASVLTPGVVSTGGAVSVS